MAKSETAVKTSPKFFAPVDFIMDYESGQCDEQETIEGFQALIDSGVVWQLQGSYGRMAASLIEAGLCHR